MDVYLETERLYIRPLMIKDGYFIIQLLNSKGWIQFIGDRNVKDIESANNYIQRILSSSKDYYNVFELKHTKTPIGVVSFRYRDNQNYPDIGFAILPQYEKRGYAIEATKNYMVELQKNGIGKIIAMVKNNNENSIKLLNKLGLLFEKTCYENDEELNMYSTIMNNS